MASNVDYDRAASRARESVTARPGGTKDLLALVRLATLAASSHNTQPWKFRVRDDAITLLPDRSRRCPAVDPDDSHLYKSLGCAAENIAQASAAQGLAAEVDFDPVQDAVVVRLRPEASAGETDLSRAIALRQCTRTAYDGRPVAASALALLQKAGEGRQVRTILLSWPEHMDTVIDYVSRGNAVQLADPAFRGELISWIRFNPAEALRTGDGLSGRTSGQPALPSWLARRIIGRVLTVKGQVRTDTVNLRSSAGVAVFVSQGDDPAAWVESGRAFQRFALQATAMDVRTAFINQPIEVRPLRAPFEAWLGLRGEHAQLMVRFGHGPLAPFSLRRPLHDVLADEPPEAG